MQMHDSSKSEGKKAIIAKGNYAAKLLALGELGLIGEPGKVQEVDIYHDDWCGVYRGQPCNCNPEIKVRPDKGGQSGPARG